MEVQLAAHGFTATSIQSRGRILLPHASQEAILSCNLEMTGLLAFLRGFGRAARPSVGTGPIEQGAQFWTYVLAALDRLHTGLGAMPLSLLQSEQSAPIETVLVALINGLDTLRQDIVLVLDDYHLIETPSIHRAMTFLLDHLPPQFHLVIASRIDPALPLSRLRVRHQLVELRVDDLRFTIDEAAAFLNEVMGLHLTAGDVAALEARTEGWIAGLQLAALSMHGRRDIASFVSAFTGSHRYIVDYLMEEVLGQQPEHIRTFLLQTSLLDRLNRSLCDALTLQSSGQATLEQLEQANLFLLPLDDERS